jgi:hypothetical protein
MIDGIVEFELLDLAPMPQILATARIVNEDVTHLAGGKMQEVQTILAADRFTGKQRQIQLVDERRWLQAALVPFVADTPGGQLVELRVDRRDELASGLFIAVSPFGKEYCCVARIAIHRWFASVIMIVN